MIEPVAEEPRPNYVLRHWRGELPLPVAYWVNGVLLVFLALRFEAFAFRRLTESLVPPLGWELILRTFGLASLAVWIWIVVGIVGSARRHPSRGGSTLWAAVAVLLVAGRSVMVVPPLVRLAVRAAYGENGMGAATLDVRASPDGRAVAMRGRLGLGAAYRVINVLDAAPSAHAIVLTSGGGLVEEALMIAAAVRDRRMDTYVESGCASACTEILLAGKQRIVTRTARIGFHQAKYPSASADLQRAAVARQLARYRQAGIVEEFAQRAAGTPTDSMWYPSADELLQSGVATRISYGGEYPTYDLAVGTKAELRDVFTTDSFWTAASTGRPRFLDRLVDSIWDVKRGGASDAVIRHLVRDYRLASDHALLRSLNDSLLDQYGALRFEELRAARRISVGACALAWRGTPAVGRALPDSITYPLTAFMILAYRRGPPAPRTPLTPEEIFTARVASVRGVPIRVQRILGASDEEIIPDEALCEAAIAYHRSLAALPATERHLAERWIEQTPH